MLTLPTSLLYLRYNQSRLKVPKDGPPQCLACLPVLGETAHHLSSVFPAHPPLTELHLVGGQCCSASPPDLTSHTSFPSSLWFPKAEQSWTMSPGLLEKMAFWLQCYWWSRTFGISQPSSKRVMPAAWAGDGSWWPSQLDSLPILDMCPALLTQPLVFPFSSKLLNYSSLFWLGPCLLYLLRFSMPLSRLALTLLPAGLATVYSQPDNQGHLWFAFSAS